MVELAGTPKAGKTTALHVLKSFLKSCGYHVIEMRERAADCPIAMKGHFFFNTWTTTTMLASMIEHIESEADVLLLDRGVFDAIVWLESQSLQHQVTEEERKVFREFVLLERWRKLTDLTFVLTVSPDVAVERENKDLLIERKGTIMSSESLTRYNEVLTQVQNSQRDAFNFVVIDTSTDKTAKATTHKVAAKLVDYMKKWADPMVAVLPKSVVESVFAGAGILSLPEAMTDLAPALEYRRRSTLIEGGEFVELVGAAMLRHEGKMLLLDRSEESDPKRKLFGRHLLWKGCHIACPDEDRTQNLLSTAASALKARLKEDLHLAQLDSEPAPSYLVWNREKPEDAYRLGVFFDLEIPTDDLAQLLASKVFKNERSRTKLGGNQFISATELQKRVAGGELKLESWSEAVLEELTKERS